jgi:hypothetical protein
MAGAFRTGRACLRPAETRTSLADALRARHDRARRHFAEIAEAFFAASGTPSTPPARRIRQAKPLTPGFPALTDRMFRLVLPAEARVYSGYLRDLLQDADMLALLAASPEARRRLRPLWRMYTADPLPALLRAPRRPRGQAHSDRDAADNTPPHTCPPQSCQPEPSNRLSPPLAKAPRFRLSLRRPPSHRRLAPLRASTAFTPPLAGQLSRTCLQNLTHGARRLCAPNSFRLQNNSALSACRHEASASAADQGAPPPSAEPQHSSANPQHLPPPFLCGAGKFGTADAWTPRRRRAWPPND